MEIKNKKRGDGYNVWKLVDHRSFSCHEGSELSQQIICDIDKTYLETSFETWLGLAKIPFEGPEDKITVPGATEVLSWVRWTESSTADKDNEAKRRHRPLHFVSSSPPQLRRVLEEKLRSDGLDWSSDTFKNQAYNIVRGRFDQIKAQMAYKFTAILKIISQAKSNSEFILIGDNAECDPLVYMGIKLFSEGILNQNQIHQYLVASGADQAVVNSIWHKDLANVSCRIKGIYIRKLKNYPLIAVPPLTLPIFYFEDYFDVAIELFKIKYLSSTQLEDIMSQLVAKHGYKMQDLEKRLVSRTAQSVQRAAAESIADYDCDYAYLCKQWIHQKNNFKAAQ